MMVPAAEALRTLMTKDSSRGIDFVDINLVSPARGAHGIVPDVQIGMPDRSRIPKRCRLGS